MSPWRDLPRDAYGNYDPSDVALDRADDVREFEAALRAFGATESEVSALLDTNLRGVESTDALALERLSQLRSRGRPATGPCRRPGCDDPACGDGYCRAHAEQRLDFLSELRWGDE